MKRESSNSEIPAAIERPTGPRTALALERGPSRPGYGDPYRCGNSLPVIADGASLSRWELRGRPGGGDLLGAEAAERNDDPVVEPLVRLARRAKLSHPSAEARGEYLVGGGRRERPQLRPFASSCCRSSPCHVSPSRSPRTRGRLSPG